MKVVHSKYKISSGSLLVKSLVESVYILHSCKILQNIHNGFC